MKKILIYEDKGTSRLGIVSLEKLLPLRIGGEVKKVMAEDILKGILDMADIFIIPGGEDLAYCEKLNGKGNCKIRSFVENGGLYIGICAGAYYACRRIEFQGNGYRIEGKRELGFFHGTASGSLSFLTGGIYYDEKGTPSKAMVPLLLEEVTGKECKGEKYYYHGGPAFIPDKGKETDDSDHVTVATFLNGMPAIIAGKAGKGSYFLSSVHFELEAGTYNELVVKKAEKEDRIIEKDICSQLDGNYGNRMWEYIKYLTGPYV